MSEAFDLFAHYFNASLIASIHFEDGLFEGVTKHLARHAQNTGSLSGARRALKQINKISELCATYHKD